MVIVSSASDFKFRLLFIFFSSVKESNLTSNLSRNNIIKLVAATIYTVFIRELRREKTGLRRFRPGQT